DLISQAEHDPLAASVLVTDSPELAAAVEAELAEQVPAALHHERIATALRGRQSGVVLVSDLDQGLAVVDAYGAEHLEIQTADAAEVAARVTNAGAVFVGAHSPVSLGDYAAGSNHVLPTGGSSRFNGGLGVQTFLRGIHVVHYDRDALAGARPAATTLAAAEGLPAHGTAIDLRFERGPEDGPSGNEPRSAGYRRAAGPASAGAVRSERVRNRATARQPSIPTAVTTAVTITKETSVPAENR